MTSSIRFGTVIRPQPYSAHDGGHSARTLCDYLHKHFLGQPDKDAFVLSSNGDSYVVTSEATPAGLTMSDSLDTVQGFSRFKSEHQGQGLSDQDISDQYIDQLQELDLVHDIENPVPENEAHLWNNDYELNSF